ncbi:MAG TPA: PKD domain-containing protein [Bacteroidales bacterium]|nr:PKD domain-containing protein [Bacteroidales bacterium]
MMKRICYIITVVLLVSFVSLQTRAQQPSVYEVKRMSFNSDAFSEISPVMVNDGIIFCSNRRFSALKDRTAYDGHRLYNIYLAERKDTSGWIKPKELISERSSLFNNGPLCFAPEGKTVYFTSEVETGTAAKDKKFTNHSGIFIAELSGTDLVSLRPFSYNNPQYEVGQPSLSSDGKYLFFASDMPGGQGGSDLYYCEYLNEEWSDPVNLGPKVNSSGAENYPYIHPSGKLYFASSRPGGIGKLDVYFTILNYGTWDEPVLLPEPINSPSDDFAFVAAVDLQTGYFSSNRGTNDDIYEFISTIIRKVDCGTLEENNYCYRFQEENAVKFDTMPFRYEWKFGDGESAIGPVVEHCYSGQGTYLVQLDVVNLVTKEVLYNEKSDTLVLKDIEQPYISAPERINMGERIVVSADSTNLPGWEIAQYYWNFGDETIRIGKEVDKIYLKPGTYNIQLIVSTEPEPGGIVRKACISKNIIVIPQP